MRPSRSPVDSPVANFPTSDVSLGSLLLGGLSLAFLVRLWIVPLGSSLSLDEFGTWWASNGGLGEILSRARLFPQSIPYVGVVWLARTLGGSGEIALRLPSLLAAGLAGYCLYRLGMALVDRETGLLAAGIFVGFRQICFAAADARPYSFAVLAAIGAVWMLVRWLERGRAADAVAYVLLATAAVYFQYLFATMFVVHVLYAIHKWRRRRGCGAPPRQVLYVAVGIVVLAAPAALLALEVARDRATHAFAVMPDAKELVSSLVPSEALGALLASLALGWLVGLVGRRPQGPPRGVPPRDVPPRDVVWLLALWAFLPAPILFVASRLTGTSLFVSRYMLWMIPGQALLLAWALSRIRPIGGRVAAVALVAGYLFVMFLARGLNTTHTNEDWRGAVAALNAINGGHPVLLSGTYTESRNLDWLRTGKHAAYMRAPLDYYSAAGPAVVLPLNFGPDAEAYVDELLRSIPASDDRFVLIERSSRFASWAPWIRERVEPGGYRMRRAWTGYPNAWVFERSVGHAWGPGAQ